MKTFLRNAFLAMVISFSIAKIAHADLTIQMHMKMGGKEMDKLSADQKAQIDKMMNVVLYYTPDKSRSNSFMSSTIVDRKLKKMYMLNSKDKTYIEMEYSKESIDMLHLPSDIKNYTYNIKDTKQSLTILGHKAHRYLVNVKTNGISMKMDLFAAQDFPAADLQSFQGGTTIVKGIPLKMIMTMSNKSMPAMTTTLIATSIKTTPINPDLFELPKDYKKTDLASLYKPEAKPSGLLAKGAEAPDFTAYTKDNKPVKLSDYKGKVVMIDFWSTWCGPCQMSLPHTQAIAKKFNAQGLVVLGVNVWDSKSEFVKWLPKHKNYSNIQFLIDTSQQPNDIASSLYKVDGIPTVYIIDKDGKVAGSQVGYDENDKTIENSISAALK